MNSSVSRRRLDQVFAVTAQICAPIQ